MSSQPPPVPRRSDYGWSWRDWLPWALFGVTLAALIAVGVWQGIRISNLEDDKSSLEAQLAGEQQANQSVSAQAKKAEQNASDLQSTVAAQRKSINSLKSQLTSAKSTLASVESRLSSEQAQDEQLTASLASVKKELESAETTAGTVSTCHEVVEVGATLNTDVTKAVGQLEGAIRAEAGSSAERQGLAATLRLLENAEASWANVSSQVSACS
jgi:chromosome segregation ATPase